MKNSSKVGCQKLNKFAKKLNKMAKKLNKSFQKLKVPEESTTYNFQTCVQKKACCNKNSISTLKEVSDGMDVIVVAALMTSNLLSATGI